MTTAAAPPAHQPSQAPPRIGASRPTSRFTRNLRGHTVAWLFLTPALVLFLVFKFIPMIRGIEMSFHDVRPYLGDRWVGVDNYVRVLTDEAFLSAINHTVILAVGQTVGSIALGFVLALLLEGTVRHLWFIRTAVFLPAIVTMAVITEVWRILYYPSADGVVNGIIGWFGAGPSQFLNSPDTSLMSVMAVGIWRGAPYDMMIIIAGLAGVDRTLYEAADVDGATTRQRLWHVTLPALRPVFAILLTLAAIRGLRVFTEIFLLTNGGPNGSTEVLMTLVYKLGLERSELGVAAAGSVVLLVATVILTVAVQVWRARSVAKGAGR
ncbi:carbohydrate ABC transporter membrane protein 1, CUT1 family [Actinokineospora alba]|uniref:Carbohydrate ABC transporter membrane protein 1, CUT1 family n=1 Tax=Actinokineospora alba TaxID=504798 RepID=A0A1H0EZ59_9PSEU|nr:sugar ABC transporter permease [Actinokineospora alba]TDP69281.1 multiple sugar transport system permease protein [Actinokineospora alba]SDI20333.1 multiple sugar transport system permease protein [Actinokineospora alba]SDN87662.1 carbohydrate ABC transporter membrane protein 1, CUT1 family [Actinokineospora alba]